MKRKRLTSRSQSRYQQFRCVRLTFLEPASQISSHFVFRPDKEAPPEEDETEEEPSVNNEEECVQRVIWVATSSRMASL
jgi:hypothetical protein